IARFARIPTSDDSSSTDVEKISGPFHTWVKENASALGLIRSSDHRALIDELEIYANHYRTLAAAARAYVPDLASVFFNAYNGMSIQT
ncbi:hypothetical protein G3I39_04855, partial [Streptomyces fulvissimus]